MRIDINFEAGSPLSGRWLQEKIRQIFQAANLDGELEVTAVSSSKLIQLKNKNLPKLRHLSGLLSFPAPVSPFSSFAPSYLGELIWSSQIVTQSAEKNNRSLKEEMTILLVHGILHLIGYDHKTEKGYTRMITKEQEILNKINP